jgi:uncharacterized protein YjiS (DUF1127 family)
MNRCTAERAGDWSARIADLLASMVRIRRRRQQAVWMRELLALDDRQLRDAGIDLNLAVDHKTAVREAITIARLNALR